MTAVLTVSDSYIDLNHSSDSILNVTKAYSAGTATYTIKTPETYDNPIYINTVYAGYSVDRNYEKKDGDVVTKTLSDEASADVRYLLGDIDFKESSGYLSAKVTGGNNFELNENDSYKKWYSYCCSSN